MKKAVKKAAAMPQDAQPLPRKAMPKKTTLKKAMPKKAALKKAAPKQPAPKKAPPDKLQAEVQAKPAKQSAAAIQAAPPPAPATAAGPAVLDRLYATIMDRRTADPARSHSARLLSRGPAKVAQKFGEEAVECLIEAVANNPNALVAESADVLYHLVVMWVASGIAPDQVWAELHRREGISGVVEKASRANPLIGTSKIP